MSSDIEELKKLTPKQIRQEFRANSKRVTSTVGLCEDYIQAGIFMLPSALADDFETFCHKNPASFPLLYRSKPGEVTASEIADGLDIRTDLGLYSIFEKDKFIRYQDDLLDYPPWNDMVTFYIGCSFILEGLAQKAGFSFRNVQEGRPAMVFDTSIQMMSVGRFHCSTWVSMRQCKRSTLEKILQITAPHEEGHGAPIHIGDPSFIGIADIMKPLCGVAMEMRNDEVPVFWACNGSGEPIIKSADTNNYVAHYEKSFHYMLVTDVKSDEYLAKHKPSCGDLKPKVVTLFQDPDFISLLSDKALNEISDIGKSFSRNGLAGESSRREESSLERAALVLSHSCCVAIETAPAVSENGSAFALAKALLEEGKKVVLFTKDDGMVSAIREETRKAFPTELLHDLQVLQISEVNMQGKSGDHVVMAMNEVCRSKFIIIVTQNAGSLHVAEQLARSTAVKGTVLDVSPWGYDVTVKGLLCLRGCPIHTRYLHYGIIRPNGKTVVNGDS